MLNILHTYLRLAMQLIEQPSSLSQLTVGRVGRRRRWRSTSVPSLTDSRLGATGRPGEQQLERREAGGGVDGRVVTEL